jgi:DNA topoisomerase-2
MTKTLEDQIAKVSEKLRFVLLIIDDKIVVFKKTKSEIANELTKHKFEDQTYLLAMPLHKFTREEVDLLKKELSELTDELKVLKGKTEKDLWMSDLDKLSLK